MDGHPFIGQRLAAVHRELTESEDPAMQYFLRTLGYLPSGSQPAIRGFVPTVDWFDDTHLRGFVQTPAEENLAYMEKYHDGAWGIEVTPAYRQPMYATAWKLSDAKRWIVGQSTFEIKIERGDDIWTTRVLNDSILEVITTRGEENPELDRPYKHNLEFWDANHGLLVGDTIVVKQIIRDHPQGMYHLAGEVSAVEKHEVTVMGSSMLDSATQW